MENDDAVLVGLEAAAEYAGVSQATIYRWIHQNLLTEDEAETSSDRIWFIRCEAIDRVRQQQATKGRGAFRAKGIRFHASPKGLLTVRLSELSDGTLVNWLFELVDIYEENKRIIGTQHPRLRKITGKLQEVYNETQRRNLRIDLTPEVQALIFL